MVDIIEVKREELKELIQEEQKTLLLEFAYVKRDLEKLFEIVDSRFVTKEQFMPVQKIVYGLVALILVAVFGALVGLVIIKQ